jgi:hypothetical protein
MNITIVMDFIYRLGSSFFTDDVSETEFVSIIRYKWKKGSYLDEPLRMRYSRSLDI